MHPFREGRKRSALDLDLDRASKYLLRQAAYLKARAHTELTKEIVEDPCR